MCDSIDMNNIKRITLNNRTNRAATKLRRKEMDRFQRYLIGSKFNCGDALDHYVHAHEVIALLDRLKDLDSRVDDKALARKRS